MGHPAAMSRSSSQSFPGAAYGRYRLSALALASIGLLAGCSDAPITAGVSTTTAGVASIPQTGTASAPARTTPAAVEGPLIRYDTSEAEITRLYRAYSACLKKQGIPLKGGKGLSQDPETLARYKRELTACAGKRPEDVPHREERKDPGAFQDHLRQQVKCMKAKGLDVILIPPNGWGVSDEAAERGYEPDFRVVNKCQLEAFGG
jgi:hypothetical protein